MGDTIRLEGIQIPAALGVTAAERRMRRPVMLDLALEVDLRRAGRSDRIGDTIHYAHVFEVVEDVATNLPSTASAMRWPSASTSLCSWFAATSSTTSKTWA